MDNWVGCLQQQLVYHVVCKFEKYFKWLLCGVPMLKHQAMCWVCAVWQYTVVLCAWHSCISTSFPRFEAKVWLAKHSSVPLGLLHHHKVTVLALVELLMQLCIHCKWMPCLCFYMATAAFMQHRCFFSFHPFPSLPGKGKGSFAAVGHTHQSTRAACAPGDSFDDMTKKKRIDHFILLLLQFTS
jgi:hypothetical protein